jgi:D-arabinose 1-dehydrogenase-like Zn-dependent alcohol dehydrogenase
MKTGTMMPIPVKMKATVLGSNQLEVKEVPTPEYVPMEALLEVEACACCCTHVA